MSVKNKTNKNYKRSQKGRSMVEMLGVLAIIGVLSVGGVYGYGVAMKKHKANELLHQASMLATTISAQAMTNEGALPQTITSFGNSSYGTFSTSVSDALNGKGFSITIKNVDSGACTQLEKMAGGMVRDVDCDEATGNATITYYKNLATNDEEGKNSPTGGSGDTEHTLVETCSDGTSTSNIGDSTNEKTKDDICRCPGDKPQWDGKECKKADTENSCTSYTTQECPEGYYCKFDEWEDVALDGHGNGICTKITGVVESNGYTASTLRLNWWSGNSWCIAQTGKGLITGELAGISLIGSVGGDHSFEGSGPYQELGITGTFFTGNTIDNGGSVWFISVSKTGMYLDYGTDVTNDYRPLCGK